MQKIAKAMKPPPSPHNAKRIPKKAPKKIPKKETTSKTIITINREMFMINFDFNSCSESFIIFLFGRVVPHLSQKVKESLTFSPQLEQDKSLAIRSCLSDLRLRK